MKQDRRQVEAPSDIGQATKEPSMNPIGLPLLHLARGRACTQDRMSIHNFEAFAPGRLADSTGN
jgi:hypothetical protein